VLKLATFLCLIAAVGAPSASAAVLGFQSEESPTSRIARDAPALGLVGVDGLNLTGRPGAVTGPTAAQRRQLRAAQAAGLPAALLVGNFSPKIGDFSEPLAWRTLSDPTASTALARTLSGDVRREGWSGISVDLESLRARDRAGLVRLLADLRADLGEGTSLTVSIANLASAAEYAANGYDLKGIAGSVDQIVLMAYDQHGPWEAAPGPIGAEGWVRAGLRASLAEVPPSQVDLGVAGYGYLWGAHGRRQVSDATARRLASRSGAHARWAAGIGEWTAKIPGDGTIWWSDARTLARRERLAASLGLHGLAVWSLGLSDPIRLPSAR
jgi:spore germination protein